VTAAAGSGKTRVLVGRIVRHLLDEGLSLQSIVAVTYTDRAANEIVDGSAGRGQRNQDQPSQILERQLVVGILEVVQELDLRERQLERPDGFEEVGVAVLVQKDHERIQIAREVRLIRSRYLHARKYCTQALIAQATAMRELRAAPAASGTRPGWRRGRGGAAALQRPAAPYGCNRALLALGRACPMWSFADWIEEGVD